MKTVKKTQMRRHVLCDPQGPHWLTQLPGGWRVSPGGQGTQKASGDQFDCHFTLHAPGRPRKEIGDVRVHLVPSRVAKRNPSNVASNWRSRDSFCKPPPPPRPPTSAKKVGGGGRITSPPFLFVLLSNYSLLSTVSPHYFSFFRR